MRGVLGRDHAFFTPLAAFWAGECLFQPRLARERLSGIINDSHLLRPTWQLPALVFLAFSLALALLPASFGGS